VPGTTTSDGGARGRPETHGVTSPASVPITPGAARILAGWAGLAAAADHGAATSLGRTETALGAFYRRLAFRVGKARAITATARKQLQPARPLLRLIGRSSCTR